MKRQKSQFNKIKLLNVLAASCCGYLMFISPHESIEAAKSVATHIGTFEGSTTFTTSSRNGINPGLFIEVMDEEGNLIQYESEEGIITVPNTKEGAYVTQAKLLGKTKYVDEETGEILDTWEEGRNLRLESSENPVLKMTGKNLFDGFKTNNTVVVDGRDCVSQGISFDGSKRISFNNYLSLEQPITISMDIKNSAGNYTLAALVYEDDSLSPFAGDWITHDGWYRFNFTYPSNSKRAKAITFQSSSTSTTVYIDISTVQVEKGGQATTYDPHKSNTITLNEDLTLRGIGDVRDELDLIKMELTKKISQPVILDGSSDESYVQSVLNLNNTIPFGFVEQDMKRNGVSVNNAFITTSIGNGDYEHSYASTHGDKLVIWFFINKSKLSTQNIDGFRQWLQVNPVMAQYELETPIIKTVGLNSDYLFKPIYQEFIEVIGTVSPLVGSITVPTNSISFTLDPNQEAGQQFVAPEFSVSNDTTAPIRLTLNSFEQTTNVLNDVLPTTYDSWEGLNKKESKDIALALVPKVSDGWVSLNEGPRYVAETSNGELGVVKAKSRVDFTFSALHGQAFEEVLNPSYRLGFVFEFMN